MAAPGNNRSKIQESEQEILNQGFDDVFDVPVTEPVVYNPATGNLDRMTQPTTPSETQPVGLEDIHAALQLLIQQLVRPIWLTGATGRLRVNIENAAGAADTLTTVTSVTGLTNIGGFDAKQGITNSLDRNLWYNSVGRCIT